MNMIGVKTQSKKNVDLEARRDLKPGELASLTKAFDTLEERKRILRMKPKPRDVEVKATQKVPVRASFEE